MLAAQIQYRRTMTYFENERLQIQYRRTPTYIEKGWRRSFVQSQKGRRRRFDSVPGHQSFQQFSGGKKACKNFSRAQYAKSENEENRCARISPFSFARNIVKFDSA